MFKKSRTGECYDYMYGFCISGPMCRYRHIPKPKTNIGEMPRIPEWYLNKIKSLFADDLAYYNG